MTHLPCLTARGRGEPTLISPVTVCPLCSSSLHVRLSLYIAFSLSCSLGSIRSVHLSNPLCIQCSPIWFCGVLTSLCQDPRLLNRPLTTRERSFGRSNNGGCPNGRATEYAACLSACPWLNVSVGGISLLTVACIGLVRRSESLSRRSCWLDLRCAHRCQWRLLLATVMLAVAHWRVWQLSKWSAHL